MQSDRQLKEQLQKIDHKNYPLYRSLRGSYKFANYIFSIDHVQGDPFAAPSDVSIAVSAKEAGFPAYAMKNKLTRTALADALLRIFYEQLQRVSFRAKGSGKSGLICATCCGQEVLVRTACEVNETQIIVRFAMGFPANGRTINAQELEKMIFSYLPQCVQNTLFYKNLDKEYIREAIELAEDQQAVREQLKERNLAAFAADGAILPRESGVSSRPMKGAVTFSSPDSLRVELTLPHRGKVTGMGIPKGITLIAGGGYHGKSTLLNALELGVYNHIAKDGRELVITDETAVKLRAEDGRFIKDADISMFIDDLPNQKSTKAFSTADASGSTSQAAAIVEAIEAGSGLILLDEDTSAANFMVRDAFMYSVISPEKEPITPFLLRARELFEQAGVSTILVAGSSGAFFHIADTVIQMDNYKAYDITAKAKSMCPQFPLMQQAKRPFEMPKSCRIFTSEKNGALQRRNYRSGALKDEPAQWKVKKLSADSFLIGKQTVDLRYVEQLVDSEQTAYLTVLLKYAIEHFADKKYTVSEVISHLQKKLEQEGMEFAEKNIFGGYALPRVQEIYACFYRYRV